MPAGGYASIVDLVADIELPIMPIEALAPASPAAPEIFEPVKPPMPPLVITEMSEVPDETPDLVGSWVAYERMIAGGVGPASLDELMGVVEPATLPPMPLEEPEPVFAASPPPPPLEVELPLVDVNELVYRGRRALVRAQELRELAKRIPPEALPALFDEVCDLVVLALEPGA
jgi:hypothetical protein